MDAVEAIESDAARCWIVTDHYEWWRDNKFNPEAGKPVWITLDDETCHHVFFDDNIKNSEKSIVALRERRTATDPFVTVPHAAARVRREVNNSLIIVNFLNFFHKIQNFRQISDLFSQI